MDKEILNLQKVNSVQVFEKIKPFANIQSLILQSSAFMIAKGVPYFCNAFLASVIIRKVYLFYNILSILKDKLLFIIYVWPSVGP